MNIITNKEWIGIFPEAKKWLEKDLEYQFSRYELLVEEYKEILKTINHSKTLNENQKQFLIQVSDEFIGDDIKKVEDKIKNNYSYIRKEKQGGINDSDIKSANDCDWEYLIKPKKKYGRNNFTAFCPFHPDKETASFLVRKGKGHCFGCGWHGSSIDFLMKIQGISFIQAVKILR